jgi:hypothetical protein
MGRGPLAPSSTVHTSAQEGAVQLNLDLGWGSKCSSAVMPRFERRNCWQIYLALLMIPELSSTPFTASASSHALHASLSSSPVLFLRSLPESHLNTSVQQCSRREHPPAGSATGAHCPTATKSDCHGHGHGHCLLPASGSPACRLQVPLSRRWPP